MPGWKTKGTMAPAGYMEQLDAAIYRFACFVRSKDGIRHPLTVAISAPAESGEDDSVCLLSCPFLRTKPFSIYGVDHNQALELSIRFVETSLEHMNATLVDADGNAIELPAAPTEGMLGSQDPQ